MKNTFLLAPALFMMIAAGVPTTGDSNQRLKQNLASTAAEHSVYSTHPKASEDIEDRPAGLLRPECALPVSGTHHTIIITAGLVAIALDFFDKNSV